MRSLTQRIISIWFVIIVFVFAYVEGQKANPYQKEVLDYDLPVIREALASLQPAVEEWQSSLLAWSISDIQGSSVAKSLKAAQTPVRSSPVVVVGSQALLPGTAVFFEGTTTFLAGPGGYLVEAAVPGVRYHLVGPILAEFSHPGNLKKIQVP